MYLWFLIHIIKRNVMFWKFSRDFFLPRPSFTSTSADLWKDTRNHKGWPVIRVWISNTGISVKQYWSASWDDHNNKLSYSCKKNPKHGHSHGYDKIFWVMEVKASQGRLSYNKKDSHKRVIERSLCISLKLKREQVF